MGEIIGAGARYLRLQNRDYGRRVGGTTRWNRPVFSARRSPIHKPAAGGSEPNSLDGDVADHVLNIDFDGGGLPDQPIFDFGDK